MIEIDSVPRAGRAGAGHIGGQRPSRPGSGSARPCGRVIADTEARDEVSRRLRARGLFTVDAKTGRVETKADAANTVPGIDPTAWIHSELKAKRPHYWPGNVSGGARGGGVTTDAQGDTSCFNPGRTWNLTRQFEYEAKYGSIAADLARRRYGGGR